MKNTISDENMINQIIDAWEVLYGGRARTVKEVERWLIEHMGPAIDDARRHVGRLRPDGTKP